MRAIIMKQALLGAAIFIGTTALSAREVEVRHAAEVEFETERGHYYQLQRSTNLVEWLNVDDRIYGHGGRERRLRSARPEDGARREFFRVVVTDAPTNGYAPWSFAGLTISLDDQPAGDRMQFLTETNGADLGVAPDPFVYTFTRTGTNEVRIETHPPTYYFDRRDVYLLTFTGPGRGTWVRDEFRRNELKDRDVGVFHYVDDGGTPPPDGGNPPPVVPTEIPMELAGLAYTFQSGETPERLEFTSATSGTEFGDDTGDDEPNVFTYTYALITADTASLIVTFGPDQWDEYSLVYTGPAQGSFVRREFKDGVLDDTDTGAFGVVGLTDGSGNPPDGGTMPTDSLAGLTYVMDDGGAVLTTLVVASSTAGTEFDDSAPTEFTYTYTVTGANTASLVLQFKVDRWDEYDLTFNAGSNSGAFVRREFDKNALKDTDTGVFMGSPTAP